MTSERDRPADPDETLIRRFRVAPDSDGGREAANELLGRYSKRAYAWCYRMVREHELALDLAQDSLLKAYRALPGFREEARFSSWFFSIVRNRCLDHLRLPALFQDEREPDEQPSPEKGPSRELEDRESTGRIVALVRDTLLPEEQEALWLRCFEGMPVDEITRALHLTTASGARGLIQTARRKLRAAWNEKEEGAGP